MTMATETISNDLADNLATKDFDVKYKNERGQDCAAEDAVTFSFELKSSIVLSLV